MSSADQRQSRAELALEQRVNELDGHILQPDGALVQRVDQQHRALARGLKPHERSDGRLGRARRHLVRQRGHELRRAAAPAHRDRGHINTVAARHDASVRRGDGPGGRGQAALERLREERLKGTHLGCRRRFRPRHRANQLWLPIITSIIIAGPETIPPT